MDKFIKKKEKYTISHNNKIKESIKINNEYNKKTTDKFMLKKLDNQNNKLKKIISKNKSNFSKEIKNFNKEIKNILKT